MTKVTEQAILDFYTYPPIGGDDWRYTFETAQIRAIEMQLLSRTALLDLANAESFDAAADLLSATEYALPPGAGSLVEIDKILLLRRSALQELFELLCIDKPIVKLFKTRYDFANLRLALRRTLTERAIGTDYSNDGNVPAEQFEEAFKEENSNLFPDYMQKAAERAVLAYYQNKDIRRIDYTIDAAQAEYNLTEARRLESIFLLGLFKILIDLTNIRTMLRLKFT
ncbi:MAG: V-type ATPase subunit, partial [Planctomycetota bacterium]